MCRTAMLILMTGLGLSPDSLVFIPVSISISIPIPIPIPISVPVSISMFMSESVIRVTTAGRLLQQSLSLSLPLSLPRTTIATATFAGTVTVDTLCNHASVWRGIDCAVVRHSSRPGTGAWRVSLGSGVCRVQRGMWRCPPIVQSFRGCLSQRHMWFWGAHSPWPAE